MQILIPTNVAQRLAKILKRRGLTETGGVLLGEHVSTDEFRIVDFTVQRAKGTFVSFLRMPEFHVHALDKFFRRTGRDFRRFNYLGEWHSHPAFSTFPSPVDLAAMHGIVNNAATGATFAVLMIVRLHSKVTLQAGTYLFLPDNPAVHAIPLVLESESDSGSRDQRIIARVCSGLGNDGPKICLVSNPEIVDRVVCVD